MSITIIEANEKYLSYKGDAEYAIKLVEDVRTAFQCSGMDMPKMLNDFVFNIEMELQRQGKLDEEFNRVDTPNVYFSNSEHGWVVIYGGTPLSVYKETRQDAEAVAKLFKLKVDQNVYWDGRDDVLAMRKAYWN
jgi:hypothetical protein